MSSKNPISFGFSVLFEIAAVVAIVSVLPRINLRPSAAASQPPNETLPLQTTDLRIQSPNLWGENIRTSDQRSVSSSPQLIEATPASPQYVEQQLDRASQRLLNTVGGAVNQASQDWLRPVQPTPPAAAPQPLSPTIGAGYSPQNSYLPSSPSNQTAHKPAHSPSTTQRIAEQRPWLRY